MPSREDARSDASSPQRPEAGHALAPSGCKYHHVRLDPSPVSSSTAVGLRRKQRGHASFPLVPAAPGRRSPHPPRGSRSLQASRGGRLARGCSSCNPPSPRLSQSRFVSLAAALFWGCYRSVRLSRYGPIFGRGRRGLSRRGFFVGYRPFMHINGHGGCRRSNGTASTATQDSGTARKSL